MPKLPLTYGILFFILFLNTFLFFYFLTKSTEKPPDMTGPTNFIQQIHVTDDPHNAIKITESLNCFVLDFCCGGHNFSSSVI